jgi:hypothetical protein
MDESYFSSMKMPQLHESLFEIKVQEQFNLLLYFKIENCYGNSNFYSSKSLIKNFRRNSIA